MAKIFIKEMIIMLLICLASILILGVLLYEYVPSNKMIPDAVSYTMPEKVQLELNKGKDVENDEIILTYSVDSTDLDNYERINTYVPGKANPFASYETSINSGEDIIQNGTSTESGNNTNPEGSTESSNNIISENSTETNNNTTSGSSTFYPDTGIK